MSSLETDDRVKAVVLDSAERALEVQLGADDIGGGLAERCGLVNRRGRPRGAAQPPRYLALVPKPNDAIQSGVIIAEHANAGGVERQSATERR